MSSFPLSSPNSRALSRRALTRRAFCRHCTGALALAGTWLSSRPATAIPPISRSGQAKFKYSLAAYSYRDLLTGAQPVLSLEQFIEDCARFGLDATELTSYYFPQPVTSKYLLSLKKRCFELGLDISGTAVGNDFGKSDPAARQREVEQVKEWIEHAHVLGAPVIRIFAGHVPEGADPAAAYQQMVAGIEECCAAAGKRGIFLALENHGGPTATAAGLLKFVKDVQSPWFGVNLDTGNFHSDDIYGELEQLAPYAINVQVKVVTKGPQGPPVPTDYGRIAKILQQSAYRGYVVLEYEEAGDPRTQCQLALAQLRVAFAEVDRS